MNITLHELATEFRDTAAQLAEMDIPEEVLHDTLESLTLPFEQKALQVAMFSRNLGSTAEQIKSAIAVMTQRKKSFESREAWLKEYLLRNMQAVNINRIESPFLCLSVRKNPSSLEIFDERQIPQTYMRVPENPAPVPDKKAIAEALKAGIDVPGCRLVTDRMRLEIK